MKTFLSYLLLLCCVVSTQAQFNQDAPWMSDLNISERRAANNPITFNEAVEAFNTYWETRDPNVKGSGYKPFKRWENYWKNFVKPDGTLPTAAELWQTWENAQIQNSSRRMVDESNWQPVGPYTHTNTGSWSSGQGRVNSFIVHPNQPNTYYVGAPAGGIWKSTDAGQTWQTTTIDNLPQIGVSGIAIDYSMSAQNTMYIATGDDDAGDSTSVGVFKSTDGGQTWQETGLNPNNSPSSMNDIYIHPTNSQVLWVATNNGVYKTTNGGTTWDNNNGTAGQNIKDIKLKPGDPNTIYAVSSNSFYKSTNGGDTFTSSFTNGLPAAGVNRYVIDVTPANSNVVYALSANSSWGFAGLYKSTNSGDNFTLVASEASVGNIFESTQAWYDMAMGVSDTDENEVYTGVLNVWKTTNSGGSFIKVNNWNQPNSSAYTHADIHLLRFFNGTLFAGTDGGIYRSTDNAANFSDLTAGLQISQFYRISVSKQTSDKMVGGLQDNGGFALNNNQWQNYYGADGMDTAVNPNDSNVYYGFTQNGGGLYISNTAGGENSGSVDRPTGENGNWVTPLAINKDAELYSGFSSLYKLSCTNTWEAVSASFGTNIDVLEIDEINSDNIYIGINSSLRKSTNQGVNFTNVETFPSNITSIEVNNTDNSIVYVTTSGGNAGRVYRSTDGGETFTNITGSLPGVTKNMIKHQAKHPSNPLFLATSLGVYRYDDTTQDWELFNNNLPNVTVTDIEINIVDNKITASTYGRGIWQSVIPVQLADNDVAVLSTAGLDSFVTCDEIITNADVVVKNVGQNSISNLQITTNLNGATNTFNWSGNIAPNNEMTIPLPEINFGSSGVQELTISAVLSGETLNTDNVLTKRFYRNSVGVANEINTFEAPEQELLVPTENACDGYWERGIASGIMLNTVVGSNNVYGTKLSGEYDNNVKSYLYTPCYNLENLTDPELSFKMAFELEEDWDIVYVEYSTDIGENWSVLGTASDPNWYNSDTVAGQNNTCFNCPGAQWTGTSTALNEYSYDLSPFNTETSIMFRFVFHSDGAEVEEGVIVDDLELRGTLSNTEFASQESFAIYPNPSRGVFNITTNLNHKFDIEVIDITGKRVVTYKAVNPNQGVFALDLSGYSSGMYFVNIASQNTVVTKKILLN